VRCGWDASAREFESNLVACQSDQRPRPRGASDREAWPLEHRTGSATVAVRRSARAGS
jgi:hypothetical protein